MGDHQTTQSKPPLHKAVLFDEREGRLAPNMAPVLRLARTSGRRE